MPAYPFHPIAAIFPLLPDMELQSLADDVRAQGLKEPIVLYEEQILDGRNRALACDLAGVAPRYSTFVGTPQQAIAHVWSTNMRRRHLTPSQAAIAEVKRKEVEAEYAAQVREMQEEAQQRQRTGKSEDGEAGGRGHKTNLAQPIEQGLSLETTMAEPARKDIEKMRGEIATYQRRLHHRNGCSCPRMRKSIGATSGRSSNPMGS